MVAEIDSRPEGAGKVGGYERLWVFGGSANDHLNAVLSEQLLGSLSHTSSNDRISALLVEPSRQNPRFVRRRRKALRAEDLARLVVCLDQGELLAVSEVHAELPVGQRNCDFHEYLSSVISQYVITPAPKTRTGLSEFAGLFCNFVGQPLSNLDAGVIKFPFHAITHKHPLTL